MEKQFNESLRAKLTEAGFSKDEQIVGGMAAQFRAALDMLGAVRGPQALALARELISLTGAQMFALLGSRIGVDALRVVAASEAISEAAEARAAEEFSQQSPPNVIDAGNDDAKPTVH